MAKQRKSKKRRTWTRVDYVRFKKAWNGSKSLPEVARKYGEGVSLNWCSVTANRARNVYGEPLKKFKGDPR